MVRYKVVFTKYVDGKHVPVRQSPAYLTKHAAKQYAKAATRMNEKATIVTVK